MSDLQLRYSGNSIAGLETLVRSAVRGIAEEMANEMAILTAKTHESYEVRKQRKWYQFWNHWWDWDMMPYQLSDLGQFDRHWRSCANNDLINLQHKLERMKPSEVLLTERMSNLIIRYAQP